MRSRLKVLSGSLYPVESFFNRLGDEEFILVLDSFIRGEGVNPEDLSCVFPEGLSEDEGGPPERFGFIEFWTYAGNQEVRISFSDFQKYLSEAAMAQMKARPDQKVDISARLDLVRTKISQIEQDHLAYIAAT
ncbi:hypothetical protein KUV57_12655 [Epibacterium sp. DP7N7-1]|nr:hypothetical protein [Epibacterium sp. DP7N7-1]